jgi:hypothetical protein
MSSRDELGSDCGHRLGKLPAAQLGCDQRGYLGPEVLDGPHDVAMLLTAQLFPSGRVSVQSTMRLRSAKYQRRSTLAKTSR